MDACGTDVRIYPDVSKARWLRMRNHGFTRCLPAAPAAHTVCMHAALPYSWAVSTLAWSVLEFPAAYSSAPGLWATAKRNLLFAADYLVRSHVTASDVPSENRFVAQVRVREGVWAKRCIYGVSGVVLARPSFRRTTHACAC